MVQQCVTGELSYPFNSAPGNTMTELLWAAMMKSLLGTGVISSGNKLVMTAGTGLTVKVDKGMAWIYGHYYENTILQTLTIDPNTNSAGTRADMLVLDCKWGMNGGIHLTIVEGTPGAVYPTGSGASAGLPMPAEPITLVGVEWQLPLYQINVRYQATSLLATDIVDWRNFVAAGTAKGVTYVIASDNASAAVQANADAIVPTGSLNAEAVINKGLNLVYSTFGGGTVQLSEGVYKTGSSILVPSNINLRGMGSNTVIQYQVAGGAYPVISIPNQTDVVVSDLAIDCGGSFNVSSPPASVSGADGVSVTEGVSVTLRNLGIYGARNNGINLSSTSSPVVSYGHKVEDCRVVTSYSAGIQISSNAAQILNNQVSNNLVGVAIDGSSQSLGATENIVSNNIIDLNAQSAVTMGSTGYLVEHNLITNNILKDNCIQTDNYYTAFNVGGLYTIRNSILGNTVVNPGTTRPKYGIYLDANCLNNTVMNNDCSAASKITTAGNTSNITCVAVASTNKTPNWIRFNRSLSISPSGASYDD